MVADLLQQLEMDGAEIDTLLDNCNAMQSQLEKVKQLSVADNSRGIAAAFANSLEYFKNSLTWHLTQNTHLADDHRKSARSQPRIESCSKPAGLNPCRDEFYVKKKYKSSLVL